MHRSPAILCSCLALAACGGGGGGGGAAGDPPTDPQAAAGAASSSTAAAADPATTFALQGGGSIAFNADGSATLTIPAGTTYEATPVAAPPPAVPSFAGAQTYAQQSGGTPDLVLESLGKSAGLSASDFGLWATVDAAGGVAATNFYAGGDATVPGLLPPAGSGVTATYSGSYVADLSGSATYAGSTIAPGPFSGSADITVDFGAGTVAASLGGLLSGTFTATSSLDRAAGTYTVNGGTFSPYAPANYVLNGAFYGTPAAGAAPPETAGTLSGTIGIDTPTAPAATYSGSFGAHR